MAEVYNNDGNISNGDGVVEVATGASAAGVPGEFVDDGVGATEVAANGLGNNKDAAGEHGLLENDKHLIHEQSPYGKIPEIPDEESTDWEPKHRQQLIERRNEWRDTRNEHF